MEAPARVKQEFSLMRNIAKQYSLILLLKDND